MKAPSRKGVSGSVTATDGESGSVAVKRDSPVSVLGTVMKSASSSQHGRSCSHSLYVSKINFNSASIFTFTFLTCQLYMCSVGFENIIYNMQSVPAGPPQTVHNARRPEKMLQQRQEQTVPLA
ncbi:hypothetical protein AMECASPLE_023711 [Ameca splendens]|uniref:Uncharacterized protein n=1 Tax=Ameca splendens TaxID=208324 RepID=A0ABV1A1R8_9TELE